jgi:uncharacterized protein (TIGR00730 family)
MTKSDVPATGGAGSPPVPETADDTVSTRSPRIVEGLDEMIRLVGGDAESLDGQLVRELMQTALRLIRDDADTGELKLVSRSMKELRYAMKVFRGYRETRKISIFGSARTPAEHPDYQAAVEFSRRISDSGWMVITGAGDGIMRAGHEGPGRAGSFGVAIRLPFETTANEIIAGDKKLITFRYFFTRKLMFVAHSHAVALFPGGFGTHDEGFEVLTLIQTGKAPVVPVVMLDAPGGRYWRDWHEYVRGQLLATRMISPEDLNLYYVTDDPQQAVDHVVQFYRNYHSQRYVGDRLALRIQQPLEDTQIDALNSEFSDLIEDGKIEQSGPLEGESAYPDLPRLSFIFNRHGYGRLRLLIDRINGFAD